MTLLASGFYIGFSFAQRAFYGVFLTGKQFFCCLDADCMPTLEISGDVVCGVELLVADAAHEDVFYGVRVCGLGYFLLHNHLLFLFLNLNFFRQLRLQFPIDLHDIRLHRRRE